MGKLAKGSSADGGARGKKQERRKKEQVLDGSCSRVKGVGEETDGQGLEVGEARGGVTSDGVRETVIEVKARKQRRESDGDVPVAAKKQKKQKKGDAEVTVQKGTGEETDRQGLNGGEEDKGVAVGGLRDSGMVKRGGDDHVAAEKKKKKKKKKIGDEEDKGVAGGDLRDSVMVRKDGDDNVASKKKKKKKKMGDEEDKGVAIGGLRDSVIVKKDGDDDVASEKKKKKKKEKKKTGDEEDKGVAVEGLRDSVIVKRDGDDNVAAEKKKKKKKEKKIGGEEEAIVKKEAGNREGKMARRTARESSQEEEPVEQGDAGKSMASEASPAAANDAEGGVKKDRHVSGLAINDKAGEEGGETAAETSQAHGAIVLAQRKRRKPRPADFLPLDVESGDGQVVKKKKGRRDDSALIPFDKKPRVIFLSRVPHGFYEDQMLKFFGQFGTVTRLILSRNKKSGTSRHYAFIEFQLSEVAAIVADCLHNYFIDGKILQCKLVPPEKVHPKTFFRADRVFKPWLGKKRHKAAHDRARNPEQAAVLLARLRKSDNKRRDKLKAMGIDYDFKGYASLVAPKPKHVKFAVDDEQTTQDS